MEVIPLPAGNTLSSCFDRGRASWGPTFVAARHYEVSNHITGIPDPRRIANRE